MPVIALDHCGFRDVVTDECGLRLAVADRPHIARQLSAAIRRLCDDERLRRCLAAEAIRRAGLYSWDRKGEMINEVYMRAIKQ